MSAKISGIFDVKLVPQPSDHPDAPLLGRFLLDKQFHGELEATSKGQMLSAGTATKGSAGYVAIERVEGTLQGRRGSFMLQHNGVMTRGDGRLTVSVVPDSGTDELVGLVGTMTIRIEAGVHYYGVGSAKATNVPPDGAPFFPPPQAITTYCRPLTM